METALNLDMLASQFVFATMELAMRMAINLSRFSQLAGYMCPCKSSLIGGRDPRIMHPGSCTQVMDPKSSLPSPGSRILHPGAMVLVSESDILDAGSRILDPGSEV